MKHIPDENFLFSFSFSQSELSCHIIAIIMFQYKDE